MPNDLVAANTKTKNKIYLEAKTEAVEPQEAAKTNPQTPKPMMPKIDTINQSKSDLSNTKNRKLVHDFFVDCRYLSSVDTKNPKKNTHCNIFMRGYQDYG